MSGIIADRRPGLRAPIEENLAPRIRDKEQLEAEAGEKKEGGKKREKFEFGLAGRKFSHAYSRVGFSARMIGEKVDRSMRRLTSRRCRGP